MLPPQVTKFLGPIFLLNVSSLIVEINFYFLLPFQKPNINV
jgi:hypothetical protein